MTYVNIMAERVGFEPTVEFPLHTLSKRARSTAPTSLRASRFNRVQGARQAEQHATGVVESDTNGLRYHTRPSYSISIIPMGIVQGNCW